MKTIQTKNEYYTQCAAERDVTSDNFSKGQIRYKFSNSSMSRWNPFYSYLRMRITLTAANDVQLKLNDQIAPNMFMGDSFWLQQNIKCNGKTISAMDDYVPQCSSLKHRFNMSNSERNSLLSDNNFSKPYIYDRIREISSDGFDKSVQLHDFRTLVQNDGNSVIGTHTMTGTNLTLTLAGGGLPDLTQSQIVVGDFLILKQTANHGFVSRITAVTATTIVISDSFPANFGVETILVNKVFYAKHNPIKSRRLKTFDLIFKPSLGLFDINAWLPGSWMLELTPQTAGKFQKLAIESLVDKIVDTDFKLVVDNLDLFIYTGQCVSPHNGEEMLYFDDIRCQSQPLTGTTNNKTFTVHKKCHTFGLAFQKGNVQDDSSFSATKFKCTDDDQLKLKVYQMRINNLTLPQTTPQILKSSTTENELMQYFYENLKYNRSHSMKDYEKFTDWLERGPYYMLKLKNKINEGSNRLALRLEFSSLNATDKPLILLFELIKKHITFEVENGLVKNVYVD